MTGVEKVKGPASYFPSIEKTYGQPIDYWQALIRGQAGLTHMQLVGWLKSAHGLGHGHANALVAGPVLRFNLPAAEAEYARLSRLLLPARHFNSDGAAALALISEMEQMLKTSGLKTRLSDMGVTKSAIPGMAQEVVSGISRLLATNPRDMTAPEVEALYLEVL